jgi:hypothetical protein
MNHSDCRNECNTGLLVRKGPYAAKALFFASFWRLSRQAFSREARKRKRCIKKRIFYAAMSFPPLDLYPFLLYKTSRTSTRDL